MPAFVQIIIAIIFRLLATLGYYIIFTVVFAVARELGKTIKNSIRLRVRKSSPQA